MSRLVRLLALAAVAALGLGFAKANAGRIVAVDLGIHTFYNVPVTFVAFGGAVAGMGVMLVAGMAADRKVRRLLQAACDQDGGPRLE